MENAKHSDKELARKPRRKFSATVQPQLYPATSMFSGQAVILLDRPQIVSTSL